MRLTQLEGKEVDTSEHKDKLDTKDLELLKELQKDVHKLAMETDLVMRRISQILEKY